MINISEKEYKKLADFIKKNYGINLGEKKQALVTGRLQNDLIRSNFKSFSEYYEYIISDLTGNGVTTLINRITTNHTFFMREPDHFNYLKNKILPYLSKSVRNKDLRIWSAGCSTGEEPYTIAMVIDEFLGKEKMFWDSKILATDISSKVLEIAKRGAYKDENISVLPANWCINYFKKLSNGDYVIVDKIKDEVIYRKLNLMEEAFKFKKKFHVIFCRNVMIYFGNETKNNLVDKFYNLLEHGGYLIIGHSEALNREKTKFKYIMPAVYRKE